MTKQEILDYLDNVLHPIVSPDNWNVYSELYDMIEELSSAEPVRHGKWVDDAIGVLRCSECNTQAPWKYGRDFIDYRWKANYCPNCGARMDEE